MEKSYLIDIKKLSLTQCYISNEKLSEIQNYFSEHELYDYPPLQIMKCLDKHILVGDHHIAYFLTLKGKNKVKVYNNDCTHDFFLNLELTDDCAKKGIFTIYDLEDRILSKSEYKKKYTLPFEDKKEKIKQLSPSEFECQQITISKNKNNLVYKILNTTPPYFANEFIYKNYIEQVSDTHFISFSFHSHAIAFVACRYSRENVLEIYMLGMCKNAEISKLSDKIMTEVDCLAKSLGKEYITVKIPTKTAVQNEASKLYEFYINYGFTHIENLESPWDPNRLCMLLIKH